MSTQEHLARALGIHSHTGEAERSVRSMHKKGGRVKRKSGGSTTRVGYQMPNKSKESMGMEAREPHFFGGLARGLASVAKKGASMAGKALSNPETRGKLLSAGKHLYGAAQAGGTKGLVNAAKKAVTDSDTRGKILSTAKDIHRDATAKRGGSMRCKRAMGGVGKMRKGQYE